jgi:hypothetical protein
MGKGKVVQVVRSDDKVSSDDDVPLPRRMMARGWGRSTADGPPLATPVPSPASSTAARAMVPGGSSGSSATSDMAVATRAAVAKKAADVVVAKEAIEEATEKKKAAKEAVKKKAVEEAVKKKAAEEVAARKMDAEDATVKKKAVEEAAVM